MGAGAQSLSLFPSFHTDNSGALSTQDPELLAALESERLPWLAESWRAGRAKAEGDLG